MLENTKKPKNDYNISVSNQPLTEVLKIFLKKTFKKFASLKKRRTFAPANETIRHICRGYSIRLKERNNTYLDIMLYSTKKI